MLDFASALYLGFRHRPGELRPWRAFSAGVPAALATSRSGRAVASAFAALQGCEAATLAASTLHLFWDLFRILADRDSGLLLDGGTYPIARWGAERVAGRGVPVQGFRHYDLDSLRQRLESLRAQGRRPLVVTDGFCPSCGRVAPVAGMLELTRPAGGRLVIDDTQALGIFGERSRSDAPYGRGGGGTLRHAGIASGDVILVCSTAKAFGVPLGLLSGSSDVVRRFEDESETRVHCSPPSIATLRAAEHAVLLNGLRGDAVRRRLAGLVCHFRVAAAAHALAADGGVFPVQSFGGLRTVALSMVRDRLVRHGVRAVLGRSRHDDSPRLSFLVTAEHSADQISQAVAALDCAMRAGAAAISDASRE